MDILREYDRIMEEEEKLFYTRHLSCGYRYLTLGRPIEILGTTKRLLEIAKNATIIRCGNNVGHLTDAKISYESDSAHTNLVRSIVKYALDGFYGWGVSPHDYDRNEIDEAILLHDLPENETGDTPDNRSRNEAAKLKNDISYAEYIMTTYRPAYYTHCRKIRRLLKEMEQKSSLIGRLIYVADKVSAIIMMLCYDKLGYYPRVYVGESTLGGITDTEIDMCTKQQDSGMLCSELWTIDYLYGRELIGYDDIGFCTAIVVMATLLVHGHWYKWREEQYIKD